LLEEGINDKGKVTKSGVKERLKQLRTENGQLTLEAENADEVEALEKCLKLLDAESEAAWAVKEAQAELEPKVLANYSKLTEAEIKTLVVDDKWFAAIEGEGQRLTQQLACRVKELEERYAQPLPELEQEVEALRKKVEVHLEKMGLVW